MKKFIAVILILFFAISCASVDAAAKKQAKKPVTRVEIETRDGFLLVGDLYFAKQKKPPRPLVILLHSFGSRASDWGVLPSNLRLQNYNVLALDLRGHGRSVYNVNLKYKSRTSFKEQDWARYPLDVLDSIEFIKKNYPRIDTNTIYIAGADLGANTAIIAASRMKNKPKKMILISPLVSFKGLEIALIVPKLTTTPMFILSSKADKYSSTQADIISRLVHSKMSIKMYEQGGSGLLLLKRNPASYTEIINYINSNK